MAITDPFVLPADVVLVPVSELSADVRARIISEGGDYAVTRPRSRSPSRIIDANAAELLSQFRSSKTIVQAVVDFSRAKDRDPEETLVDAFPLIQRLVDSQLLVPADSPQAGEIIASLEVGNQVAGFEIVSRIQLLEDTELYLVRNDQGTPAALKIARLDSGRDMQQMFDREAAILGHLDGAVNPRLLAVGEFEGRPYVAMEWCPGVLVSIAADELRHGPRDNLPKSLLDLCCSVLEAYVHLHAQGVIHSDIHPRNVLVDAQGAIKLVDFGLARRTNSGAEATDAAAESNEPGRAGVGFFFEPELAHVRQSDSRPPKSSMAGEQYALGAMLYFLFTGAHYVDFSLEKGEMFRQIVEDNPLPFSDRGVAPWPDVERCLAVALSKEPSDRFPSVAAFAQALRSSGVPAEPAVRARKPSLRDTRRLLDAIFRRFELDGSALEAEAGTTPLRSINTGTAGVAYALYRTALIRDDAALLSLADIWSMKATSNAGKDTAFHNRDLGITPELFGRTSLYHTASGVHFVRALIAHAMGDLVTQQEAIEAFILASSAPSENLDLIRGKPGTLLGCALLLDATPDSQLVKTDRLIEFGNDVMRSIWDEIDSFAAIHECPELVSLGIAHGWAGVLYATMRWAQSTGKPLAPGVEERLHQLAERAEPAGRGARWPWRRQRSSGDSYDYMPGWCNGTAGFVHLWTLAHGALRDAPYLELAEKAAWNAWEERNAVADLCCGLAGRAYSLLNLYKHTSDTTWLRRAEVLADRAAVAVEDSRLSADSLYKGKLGIALLAAELERPEAACMPVFEHEGWPARR